MVTPVLVVTSVHADAPTYILRQPLLQVLCPDSHRWPYWRGSTWLLAASSNSNLGEVTHLVEDRTLKMAI